MIRASPEDLALYEELRSLSHSKREKLLKKIKGKSSSLGLMI
jgi:hypothetical protein